MQKETKIIVYGEDWCSDCVRAKKFLSDHKIQYLYIDSGKKNKEGKNGYNFVLDANDRILGKRKRKIPVILFTDGDILIEPSNQELTQKLGI